MKIYFGAILCKVKMEDENGILRTHKVIFSKLKQIQNVRMIKEGNFIKRVYFNDNQHIESPIIFTSNNEEILYIFDLKIVTIYSPSYYLEELELEIDEEVVPEEPIFYKDLGFKLYDIIFKKFRDIDIYKDNNLFIQGIYLIRLEKAKEFIEEEETQNVERDSNIG